MGIKANKGTSYTATTSTADNSGFSCDTNGAGTTLYYGAKITTTKACTLYSVTNDSSDTATMAYLYNATGTTKLACSLFSSHVATFNYPLADATSYIVAEGSEGAAYNLRYSSGGAHTPVNGTNLNYVDSWKIGTGGGQNADNIKSITTTTSSTTTTMPKAELG